MKIEDSDIAVNNDDAMKARIKVMKSAFGISSLPENQIFIELEAIYWAGYKHCADKLRSNDNKD